ncbi:MAG: phospho-N-acetylmuramoyl-pentapeptide-transferase [Candidatus Nanopelagicales bacterium]|nr:phospho-N-acetylmuramoyl-pentapeptide-transferase [Candidatus Nanopelagicales bacterium]
MLLVVLAGAFATVFSLIGTPLLINLLRKRGIAQAIRESTEDVNYPEHGSKRGTPSMGGVAIVSSVVLAYFLAHLVLGQPVTASGLLAIYLMLALSLVGLADDYLKIFKQRSTGIRARTKLLGQAVAALSFGYLAMQFPDEGGNPPISNAISWVRDTNWILPSALILVWIWFLVTGITNGVNLTDGLDGLAIGAALLSFVAYTVMSIWQYGQSCFWGEIPRCYTVRDPLDLAVFAAATAGACFGFLWWNSSPARIFMGDTGSLALGGGLAALALMTRTELLLGLIGGLFVLITLSVIAQVGSYKLTGRRVLRMAPLHHHFEMSGWPEVLIVVRFWIIQGLCVGAGMALFYAEWVRQ